MHHHHQFRPIFQCMSAPSVVLLPDAPKFTIVAANDCYLDIVNTPEKELIGKGIFEAFPENPEDRLSKGVENLRNSLMKVVDTKAPDTMPLQKYDIPIRNTSGFKVKYATIQNIPIKDEHNKITHILHSIEDVTVLKKMEASLESEKQRFNELYDQAPSCMGRLKGPDYVYELANPLYLELIGVKEVIGKTVKEVLPELEAQGIFKYLDKVYKTGETFAADEMLVKFDQEGNGKLTDRYLNFIYQANRDHEGVIDGILFFATDVTELVEARKKIEESESRYKELIQNLPVATYSCNLEGTLLFYNKAAVALWGKEPDIGKKWCGSWKIYSKDGNPLPVDLWPVAIAAKKSNNINYKEIIVERPNGQKRNVRPYPVPFTNDSGEMTEVVSVLIDITESKKAEKIISESEKKYRQIVETAQEGIWLIDKENKTTFVNNKLCEILEYTRNEMMGKNIFYFMDEEARQLAISLMQKKREGNSDKLQFKYISKSGKEVWTHISTNPLFDEEGAYIGSLAMVIDITAQKITDEKLKTLNNELADQNKEKEKRTKELSISNRKLIKTNRELDRFVYSVSHDLRSPLTSVLGLISIIEEDSKEPETLEQVKMIHNSITRLDGFIKNILSYSQNNRMDLEIQQIPIAKAIHEIVDSVRNIKMAAGISFQIDIDDRLPFHSDRKRFNTILENLISNAIKYHTTKASGRYLKISGTSTKNALTLSIADNGMGIDPNYHDKIFNMFYRLPGKTEGSGLGLYIVKEAIEKLQGSIEIQSEIGEGTTFFIKLKNLKP